MHKKCNKCRHSNPALVHHLREVSDDVGEYLNKKESFASGSSSSDTLLVV